MEETYSGACFCGAVEIKVSGQPNAMGYCHCRSCRSWSGGPVNAFSLWSPEAVTVTKGADNIATFHKTDMSHRQYCKVCGGHLMTNHPPLKMIDLRRDDPGPAVRAGGPRQLRGDGAADARRLAEAEGFPVRVRRVRRDGAGVMTARLGPAVSR